MPGAQALQESSTEIFLTQNNYVVAKIKLLITNLSRKHFINKNHVVNPPQPVLNVKRCSVVTTKFSLPTFLVTLKSFHNIPSSRKAMKIHFLQQIKTILL